MDIGREITKTIFVLLPASVAVVYLFNITDWEDGWFIRIVAIFHVLILVLKIAALLWQHHSI